jgi:hypothetical protein
MRSSILLIAILMLSISIYGQEYVNGSIVTQRYDTITNVKIKKMSDAKSLLHISYLDENGNEQEPPIETIKCYTRGDEVFCRIYSAGEMIFAKQIVKGEKLNLFERDVNGSKLFYIEKIFDELIKVPVSNGKFRKVLSSFLSDAPQISTKIQAKELVDIYEIVNLYNKG